MSFVDDDIRLQEITIELSNMRVNKIFLEAEKKRILAREAAKSHKEIKG